MARRGKIKAIKIGNHWVTTKEWLEDYAGSVKDVGRPEKPKKYKLEINILNSEKGRIFKKYLTNAIISVIAMLSLVSFYSAVKPNVAPLANSIGEKIEKVFSLNSYGTNNLQSQAITETNKIIASVFEISAENKRSRISAKIIKRIAWIYGNQKRHR